VAIRTGAGSDPAVTGRDGAVAEPDSPSVTRAASGAGRRPGRGSHASVRHRWDVTWHLVGREIATRHRGSLLGWFWSLVPPLLQFAAAYLVFTRVIPLGIENYPVFLLVGVFAWNWLSRSVSAATTSLESSRDLVVRPGFDTGLLPLAQVLVNLVDFLLALPVLGVALLVTDGMPGTAALFPVLLLVQFALTVGLALIVSPLQVYFRDVQHAVALAVMVGFWVTPIFYQARNISGPLGLVYDLNPMAHLIEAQRDVLLSGVQPDWSAVVWVAAASVVILAVGVSVFSALRTSIPDRL
jgi:lipopolysaccharide transport system permease protein